MRDFAKPFYKSQAWLHCRFAYAKSRGGLCENCLAKGIYRPGEIVHHLIHITPENVTDPNVTLNWDNLVLLCRDCHGEAHQTVERRYKVDELGRVSAK